ncbi:Ras guanine nucleotide exchange factor [Balamuthia mandrillaris]
MSDTKGTPKKERASASSSKKKNKGVLEEKVRISTYINPETGDTELKAGSIEGIVIWLLEHVSANTKKEPKKPERRDSDVATIGGFGFGAVDGMEEQRKRIIDHNEHMLHVFIVSYRQFVSPTDFFSILVNRFKTVKEKESRLAVLKMLGVWLDKYMARDFFFHDKGNRLFDQLLKFIDSMVEMGYQEEGNKLKLLILRIKAGLHDSGRPRLLAASMITPILRNRTAEDKGSKALERSTSSGDLETLGDSAAGDDAYKKFSLCEMPLVELAEQLTLIELQMFRAIREREFLNLNWKKPENKRNSRHVVKMVERFNKVSYWVATRIVRETDLKRRTSLVKRFIILAEKCAELNNFNTLMEVLAGLNLHPVQRLKQTWSVCFFLLLSFYSFMY